MEITVIYLDPSSQNKNQKKGQVEKRAIPKIVEGEYEVDDEKTYTFIVIWK